MGHLKTFAKGVALGGIVGVIYGLFSAPKKGSEMKKEAKTEIVKLVKKGKKVEKRAVPKVKRVLKKIEKSARGGSALGKKIVKKYNKRKKK